MLWTEHMALLTALRLWASLSMTEGYLLDPLYIDSGSTVPVCCSIVDKLGRIFSWLSRMRVPARDGLKQAVGLGLQQGSELIKSQLSANTALLRGAGTASPSPRWGASRLQEDDSTACDHRKVTEVCTRQSPKDEIAKWKSLGHKYSHTWPGPGERGCSGFSFIHC